LDERSFLLVINQLIDREDENMKIEKFILIIYDHGKPEKSIRLEYRINIIDLNDSPPKFNQSIRCNFDLDYTKNRSKNLHEPLFQVQAIDLDLGDNGRISYSILPPYENLFMINNQGQIFNFEDLNESSYHLQIIAIDHGKPVQLNSTYDCYISKSRNRNLGHLNKPIKIRIFKYNYLLFLILIIFVIIIGLIFCFYKFIHNQQRDFKPNKTYHLYVSIPRKSLYINDQSPCDKASEECIHLNSDQSSEKVRKNFYWKRYKLIRIFRIHYHLIINSLEQFVIIILL
jgi:hypothetical protein